MHLAVPFPAPPSDPKSRDVMGRGQQSMMGSDWLSCDAIGQRDLQYLLHIHPNIHTTYTHNKLYRNEMCVSVYMPGTIKAFDMVRKVWG